MPRAVTIASLVGLTEDQWGLFTRRQAQATGMAWTTLDRLVRAGAVERVAHGVYRMRGTPPDDQVEVCAAWLQLAPGTGVWERAPDQGIVCRRSAAAVYSLGHLPADVHQFTLPVRRQSRRADVQLHRANLPGDDWTRLGGLLVTRPSRTAADLLEDREDPEAVAQVIADALRDGKDRPGRMERAVAPYAARFGFGRDAGMALLEWLLDLTGDARRGSWLTEAHKAAGHAEPDASAA